MLEVLKACEKVIVTDAQILSLLSTYDGTKPAFFDEIAPEDVTCPYIVVSNSNIPNDLTGIDSLQYTVDIFDEGLTPAKTHQLIELVEKAVLFMPQRLAEAKGFSVTRSGYNGTLPDEIPSTHHGHIEFTIRYGRISLFTV